MYAKQAIQDLLNDPDVSQRVKERIQKEADYVSGLTIQFLHLAYLMGRTDMANDTLTRSIQRQKAEESATTNNPD